MHSLISNILIFLILYVSVSQAASGTGYASCYGDYRSVLSPFSVVSSGLGSFIQGEDWTYTTAMCSDWANKYAGACFEVQCNTGSGTTGGMKCKTNPQKTYVKVIDTLGNDCNGNPKHVFDLNDLPFDQLGTDGASCSGQYGVTFSSVSCQTAGIVSGGIKIGLPPNQVDPWCPSFLFSNVGGSGALHSVSVSPNGGATWYSYTRNSFNGARWDCNSGSGSYLGKSISFRLTSCAIDGVPNQCNPAETITLTNALPLNWCGAQSVPCNSGSFQASANFGSGGQQPPPPTQQPPAQQPPAQQPPTQPAQSGATTRCGPSWVTANTNCMKACVSNDDCGGQTCYANLDAAPCAGQQQPPPVVVVPPPPVTVVPPPVVVPPPPQQMPPPKPTGSGTVRCGADWTRANSECGNSCITNNDCATGTYCFAGLSETSCGNTPPVVNPPPAIPPPPVVVPPPGVVVPPPPVVVPPPPVQTGGSARCGADWGGANSNCGASCKLDGDCPNGQYCFADLNEAPCGATNPPPVVVPPPPVTNPLPLPPSTGSGCGFIVTESHLQRIMERPGEDLSKFVEPLNYALRKYQMDCPERVITFLAQVRHETASLTIFHQPADNGAGSLHMVPTNWGPMCTQVPEIKQMFAEKFPGRCGNCECLADMAVNQFGPDATIAAKEIFGQPLAGFLSGTWWFASGSSTPELLGWKGCRDLRTDSDVGLGAPGASDCRHTGYYQVTCCVFWTIGGSAGMPQRLRYYDLARNVISGSARAIADNDSSENVQQNTDSSPSSLSTGHIAAIAGTAAAVIIIIVIVIVVVAVKSNKKRSKREESV